MSKKRISFIVVEEGEAPPAPQLVPVTIAWVEADRAYRVTFVLTFVLMGFTGILVLVRCSSEVVILGLLCNVIAQTLTRAYLRYRAQQAMERMKERLRIR